MTTPTPRSGHPFYMYDELHAQPSAIAAALEGDEEQRDHVARELAGTHSAIESVVGTGFLAPALVGRGRLWLAGCGTAHHAALTGAEWFRRLSGGHLDVQAVQSFEFNHYYVGGPRGHDALLALSHSGIASATVTAAERAKTLGMYTVALTGVPASAVTLACDETIQTTTAPTVASTYTISHLTMLATLGDLAVRAAGHLHDRHTPPANVLEAFQALPNAVAAVLAREGEVRAIIDALPPINQVIFAGANVNWHTAQEGALKVREAAYLSASGMELEEVLHGPPASFDDQTVLFVIAPQPSPDFPDGSATRVRALDILRAMRHIGVTTVAIGSAGDDELASAATAFFALPDSPEIISVVPATVVVQLVAYWLAMARGTNPDRIRRDQPAWQAARDAYVR